MACKEIRLVAISPLDAGSRNYSDKILGSNLFSLHYQCDNCLSIKPVAMYADSDDKGPVAHSEKNRVHLRKLCINNGCSCIEICSKRGKPLCKPPIMAYISNYCERYSMPFLCLLLLSSFFHITHPSDFCRSHHHFSL